MLNLPTVSTGLGATSSARDININGFLSSLNTRDFYSFDGSLTTPPCSEGVKWAVLKEVQPISSTQLSQFTALWAGKSSFANGNGNNRQAQPLNDRVVYFYSEEADFMNYKDTGIIVLSILTAVFAVIFCAVGFCMCFKATKKE